jgi:hypothetical protein
LALEDFEVVTVICELLVEGVAFGDCFGGGFADRSARSSVRILPVESILFTGSADDLLCVLIDALL